MQQAVRTKTVAKPRAINIFLIPREGKKIDINTTGLVSVTFDRYLNFPKDQTSGILQTIDITLFSKTGNDIIGLIQRESGNLMFQYGYENEELSPVYHLQIVKLKTTRQQGGHAISIGAIGVEKRISFPAEIYKQGTKISDILYGFARRNDWSTDISCDLRLPTTIFKDAETLDSTFIEEHLLPLANRAVLTTDINYSNSMYWEYKIYKTGPQVTLHFRPKNTRGANHRIWSYGYGTTHNNQIISMTQDLDLTHLIKGLNLRIPASAVDRILFDQVDMERQAEELMIDLRQEIKEIHDKYNIPMLNIDAFKLNITLIDEDDFEESETDIKTLLVNRILEAIDKAVSVVNKIDLTIIGNPEILPTDLIELTVKNIDGTYDWLTTPIGASTYWKVIGIRENIGINGYTTELKLVKEVLGV